MIAEMKPVPESQLESLHESVRALRGALACVIEAFTQEDAVARNTLLDQAWRRIRQSAAPDPISRP